MARLLGSHNEILADPEDLDPTAVIANYCFIGKGVRIGAGTKIGNYCEINPGTSIGKGCLINSHCHLNSDTVVGDGTIFGSGVLTADERHMTARTCNVTKEPCRIGKDCRIGQGARLICCSIGNHATIGAGAIVLRDVPAYQVWAGVPARYMRDMTPRELNI